MEVNYKESINTLHKILRSKSFTYHNNNYTLHSHITPLTINIHHLLYISFSKKISQKRFNFFFVL